MLRCAAPCGFAKWTADGIAPVARWKGRCRGVRRCSAVPFPRRMRKRERKSARGTQMGAAPDIKKLTPRDARGGVSVLKDRAGPPTRQWVVCDDRHACMGPTHAALLAWDMGHGQGLGCPKS